MAKTFRPWQVDQVWLLPPSVRELVPERSPAHFIRELVREELDLAAILDTYDEERGFPPYHPVMMTALLLYAYTQGVYSKILKGPDGYLQGYNCQAAVDAKAQVIVAHATSSQQNGTQPSKLLPAGGALADDPHQAREVTVRGARPPLAAKGLRTRTASLTPGWARRPHPSPGHRASGRRRTCRS